MKTIQLTLGHSVTVDDSDYDELMKYKWCFSRVKGHSVGYATRSIMVDGKKKTIMMHRQIMNPKPSEQVDHIDGYGLNNSRSNLRLCCHMENHRNMHIHRSNLLGIKGVSRHSKKVGFFARITVNYKSIYLGYFMDIQSAIEARRSAEVKYFGEFRRKAVDSVTA